MARFLFPLICVALQMMKTHKDIKLFSLNQRTTLLRQHRLQGYTLTMIFYNRPEKDVQIVNVTLHVGPGTFLPVRDEDVTHHKMHAEPWSLSEGAAEDRNQAKDAGRRVIAVGTTVFVFWRRR